MLWKPGRAGDASLASVSSPSVGGRFHARFHWALEYDAGDVLSFSSWAVFFWASSMTEVQGGDSLLLLLLLSLGCDLSKGWGLGQGSN